MATIVTSPNEFNSSLFELLLRLNLSVDEPCVFKCEGYSSEVTCMSDDGTATLPFQLKPSADNSVTLMHFLNRGKLSSGNTTHLMSLRLQPSSAAFSRTKKSRIELKFLKQFA